MRKHAIISGATGNLGRAVTDFFLSNGWVVSGTTQNVKNKDVALQRKGVTIFPVDLIDPFAVEFFVNAAVNKNGLVSAAIMLAGGFEPGYIEETSIEQVMKMNALNFSTAFHLSKLVYSHMLQNKVAGRMVFIGAQPAAEKGFGKNAIAYALSKTMVIKYAEILSAAGKEAGIKTLLVIPSVIDTKENRSAMPKADFSKWATTAQIANKIYSFCAGLDVGDNDGLLKMYGKD